MKVVSKEPIQSLNAFGRHFDRGSIAALPLLFFRPHLLLIVAVTCLTTGSAIAQQKDTNNLPSDEKQIDVLFDRIMNTLPNAERMKVDSAASTQARSRDPQKRTPPAFRERETMPKTAARRVEELPPELKAQVERTINSMESRRDERKVQFRETTRERH